MSYKSPIIVADVMRDAVKRIDEAAQEWIYSAVMGMSIDVDKEELLRALKYDRGQYEAGYNDCRSAYAYAIALSDPMPVQFEMIDDTPTGRYRCPRCAHHKGLNPRTNYCSNCGQKLQWEGMKND